MIKIQLKKDIKKPRSKARLLVGVRVSGLLSVYDKSPIVIRLYDLDELGLIEC